MGYFIRRVSSARKWKVQWQTYVGGRKIRDIPAQEMRTLGFMPGMTEDEARARVASLNAQERVSRKETSRQAINERLAHEWDVTTAFIPEHLRLEFEKKYLPDMTPKAASHWKAAVEVMCEVALPPEDWGEHPEKFYKAFAKRSTSYSYVQKIIPLLNKWGYYYAKKHGQAFLPLAAPRGRAREAINDSYFKKQPDGLASDPLSPSALEKAKSSFEHEHQWRWLFISVWLGLRPNEIDSLHSPSTWEIVKEGKTTALAVYQSKLTSKPRAERWKYIPLLYKEQEWALEYIKAGTFDRPLAKTVRRHLGERVTCYGGRKGFTDLMLAKGQPLEAISAWLGHASIERTWRSYKNRKKITLGAA